MCVAFCPVADRDAADFEIAALVADIRFSFSVDVEVEFTVFPISDADELVPLVVEQGGAAQGGSNKMYCIADPELDNLIMTARESLDQSYRKTMYKACLDIVVDWAVEVPVYQRQNAIIFSTERVNMSTVTPDITTFYKWYSEIEKIELN